MRQRTTAMSPGWRYGKWISVSEADVFRGHRRWLCVCDCGNTRLVAVSTLASGDSESCGCTKAEDAARRAMTHGMGGRKTRPPEYSIWAAMIQRCTAANRESYRNYGGRGICVDERWRDFTTFYGDMGPRPTAKHSIDRINNDGNYEPGNCRWATAKEQCENRRPRAAWKKRSPTP